MFGDRKRTPILDREREAKASGSGPVITYKLTPRELETYRATGRLIREEESMNQLTKEQYLQMRLKGKGRSEIMKEHFSSNTVFYRQMKEWGIREKDAEERELDLFAARFKPENPVNTTSGKIEIDLDDSGVTTPIEPGEITGQTSLCEPGEAANVDTPPQDQPTSLAKQIEELIRQHSSELSITSKIKQWATDRNLHTADPAKQMLKLGEEYGELCRSLAVKNIPQVIDSIGDMYVVLVVLSLQLGLNIESCIDQAYQEIKDRKGRIVNGVFIKDIDTTA